MAQNDKPPPSRPSQPPGEHSPKHIREGYQPSTGAKQGYQPSTGAKQGYQPSTGAKQGYQPSTGAKRPANPPSKPSDQGGGSKK